jgi:chromosome partitioning protein
MIPMKVLAILSQKGGAGKTTLALHLAVEAQRLGLTTAVIDLDPQASAASWGDGRQQESPVVVSAQASRLNQVLSAAKEADARLAIIDTAPHSESAALAAAREADLILIPCRPAILDLRAISHTIDLARIVAKPVAVVLNSVPSRGSLLNEALEALEGYDVMVCPESLGQRSAFIHSLTAGLAAQEYEPPGKAASEINRLTRWTLTQLGLTYDQQEAKPVRCAS